MYSTDSILVFGDSYAAGLDGHPNDGWSQLLGIHSSSNLAVPGSTIRQWINDKEGRFSQVRRMCKSRTVFMSLSGNDLNTIWQDKKINEKEWATLVYDLYYIMHQLEVHGTSDVYVFEYPDPFFGKNPVMSKLCRLLNGTIRGITCCVQIAGDLESTTSFHTIEWQRILKKQHFDGKDIHPNIAGHKAMANYIKRYILPK